MDNERAGQERSAGVNARRTRGEVVGDEVGEGDDEVAVEGLSDMSTLLSEDVVARRDAEGRVDRDGGTRRELRIAKPSAR
jgi:hypothetical protein